MTRALLALGVSLAVGGVLVAVPAPDQSIAYVNL